MAGAIMSYVRGSLKVRITGEEAQRFLNLCAAQGIPLWNIRTAEQGFACSMSVRDFFRIRNVRRKTRSRVTILYRYGLPFFVERGGRRPVFFAALFCSLVFIWLLTCFVWEIRITGNVIHSSDEFLQFLSNMNVQYGMRCSRVNCEEIESAIRLKYDDVLWVSASLSGTGLTVEVRENTESYKGPYPETAPGNLVSDKAGVVTRIIVDQGTAAVKPGDSVEAGQVLIQGFEERLDDSGTVTGYTRCRAAGNVVLATRYDYDRDLVYEHTEKIYTDRKHSGWTFWLFGREISLPRLPCSYENADVETKEGTVTIGSDFYLPVRYRVETCKEYTVGRLTYTPQEAERILQNDLDGFAANLIEKGVEIMENSVRINIYESHARARGIIECEEPAGIYGPYTEEQETMLHTPEVTQAPPEGTQ